MGFSYVVELTPASRARLLALTAMTPVMASYFTGAMTACVLRVEADAKRNTADGRFKQVTGTLLRGIRGRVETPYRGVVGVGREVPYARRRELGFSGMTDSLGRYYPHDPGQFYLRDALQSNLTFIAATFRTATSLSIRSVSAVGGGIGVP